MFQVEDISKRLKREAEALDALLADQRDLERVIDLLLAKARPTIDAWDDMKTLTAESLTIRCPGLRIRFQHPKGGVRVMTGGRLGDDV